ncbi:MULTISPECIES: hypothetical protein [unclassified Streptomyces]|uniref:hypothetical protein n=1 Tax=Streptomyces TaxID=1883 RepID=UPI0001C18B2D|nr:MULTISPECIES: hypothetical protein [unclassified Streptomyces]MYR68383.1 hypothetical protein [Streptomyces sp. SID4939]MYS02718.1 hypothetical protein [Streptomyces sp. SID4940]MYT66738.1 hypothetical protein [Streptomyces sp. SID8357]MYT83659.1 hypothetical protein [Streptomyces sp. SID8360]MYU34373.1 hypothetical protein [Streptomyces sp. SID8358]MYW35610.1 hypothetical protein [Streptomyces sp. SID1]MYX76286.1 hypothetical protein [Streptomyces sp. SID3915]
MSSSYDPQYAPVGDVGTALMMIDSRLKGIHDGRTETDPEQQALIDQFAASLGPKGADDVLDGVCTLIFMFMTWLRKAHEDHDKDVIEYVVPNLVATMRMMPKSVRPEAVPTMAGLVVAAGTGLSPNLWRKQYGEWTEEEMTPLEATASLLAEHINRITDDPDFATRLITEALTSADED